eukprot:TRINITY_DN7136_c0_g1_i1.p1 TRINITY_DN7136_c0_g1~~TRINITY_DN7136_c0_g1_i1.p1  ORF type:complete len:196 (-),score=55.21 TRINITY_DN7136_c0_g1_i1:288-875(-)
MLQKIIEESLSEVHLRKFARMRNKAKVQNVKKDSEKCSKDDFKKKEKKERQELFESLGLPLLPKKSFFNDSNSDTDRVATLQNYLDILTAHPRLRREEIVLQFLYTRTRDPETGELLREKYADDDSKEPTLDDSLADTLNLEDEWSYIDITVAVCKRQLAVYKASDVVRRADPGFVRRLDRQKRSGEKSQRRKAP